MDVESIRDFCLSKPGTTEHFPFDADTLVFKVYGKMFALLPLEKFERGEGFINLKCDPQKAIELRERFKSVQPGYHMNKQLWNSVYLSNNEIKPQLLKEMIDDSYDLVFRSLPKKFIDTLEL